MFYWFDWSIVADHGGEIAGAAIVDLRIACAGFALACAVGMALALARAARLRVLSLAVSAYVLVARGMPPYVLLGWLYFALPLLAGIKFSAAGATIWMIGVTGSGYTVEIFRAAGRAVTSDQRDAARALGMSPLWLLWDVILPQALRVALAPLGNVFVGHLKVATVASVLGVHDMVFMADEINYTFMRPFEAYTVVCVVFLVVVAVVSSALRMIEKLLQTA